MKTILLVDDNKNFREVLKEMFNQHHLTKVRFIEASTAIEALEKFYKFESEIEMVICDYYLPIQNGSDVLELIHNKRPLIKCFLISGDATASLKKYEFIEKIYSKLDLDEFMQNIKLSKKF